VYCTCAFAPEENEVPLNHLLRREPGAALVPIDIVGPQSIPGLTRWRTRQLHPDLLRAVRILPDVLWDGFFLAKIVKRTR
jgi:16S rRNA (cytosine1407-C5)-methyltransferase